MTNILKKIGGGCRTQRRYDLWWPLNPWPWSLTDLCLPDLKSLSFMSKPVISTRLVEANVNVDLLLHTPYPPQRIFLSDRRNLSRAWGKLCFWWFHWLRATSFVITLQEKCTLTPVAQWFGMSWVTRPGTSFAFGNLWGVDILHNSSDMNRQPWLRDRLKYWIMQDKD